MPNLTERDYHNMSINQSFKAFKHHNLKVIYSLKLDKNDSFEKKHIITKIVKFDENNQYGFPNSIEKMQQKNDSCTMKFYHQ